MEELWRDVKDYEGLYMVSNTGRIKSLNYRKTEKSGILKPRKDEAGYLTISLYKDGEQKTYRIHRLVAQAFIPNPEGLPEINHIDEIKANNCVTNLEWCSHQYNINYRHRTEKAKKSMVKPVRCVETNTIYFSIYEAQRKTGIDANNIGRCANHEKHFRTVGGCHWEYLQKESEINMRKVFNEKSRVEEILENGLELGRTYPSIARDKYNGKAFFTGTGDLYLVIKYFSGLGYKPKKIAEEIKKLIPYYDEYDWELNNFIDKSIRKIRATKNYELHEVKPIKVSRECLDYFVNLQNAPYREDTTLRREMSQTVIKIMFVFYIWTLVQKQFGKENWRVVDYTKEKRRLLKAANARPKFELGLLGAVEDTGTAELYFSYTRIYHTYTDKTPEFPEREFEVDLDNIGCWFEKMVGWKDERAKETYYYCSVCGKKMKTSRKNQVCPSCKKKINREKSKERMKAWRAKKKEEMKDEDL